MNELDLLKLKIENALKKPDSEATIAPSIAGVDSIFNSNIGQGIRQSDAQLENLKQQDPYADTENYLRNQFAQQKTQQEIGQKELANQIKMQALQQKAEQDAIRNKIMMYGINSRNLKSSGQGGGVFGGRTKVSESIANKVATALDTIRKIGDMSERVADPANAEYLGWADGKLEKAKGWLGLQNQESKLIHQDFDMLNQEISKLAEGGVLKDADRRYYQGILSNPSTDPKVSERVLNSIRDGIKSKLEIYIDAQQARGLDMSEFKSMLGDSYAMPKDEALPKNEASPKFDIDSIRKEKERRGLK